MRVARRFMPRLKTSSEVATMHYLRTRSSIPVPDVYAHDSEPHNRLGAEYILMSKVPSFTGYSNELFSVTDWRSYHSCPFRHPESLSPQSTMHYHTSN
jgi:hypothetical protein